MWALASSLYAQELSMHQLPIFGSWLYEELDSESDPAAMVTTQQFGRFMKAMVRAQGYDPTKVGAHGIRQGKAWKCSTAKPCSQM